jgi:hypothetical protein
MIAHANEGRSSCASTVTEGNDRGPVLEDTEAQLEAALGREAAPTGVLRAVAEHGDELDALCAAIARHAALLTSVSERRHSLPPTRRRRRGAHRRCGQPRVGRGMVRYRGPRQVLDTRSTVAFDDQSSLTDPHHARSARVCAIAAGGCAPSQRAARSSSPTRPSHRRGSGDVEHHRRRRVQAPRPTRPDHRDHRSPLTRGPDALEMRRPSDLTPTVA